MQTSLAARMMSALMGTAMLTFGILKFFHPFKDWYGAQVSGSGMGPIAYFMGIGGEILAGLLFAIALLFRRSLPGALTRRIAGAASVLVMVLMATGIYVHLQPGVPASVLPMNIKPPYLPAGLGLMAVIHLWLLSRQAGLSSRKLRAAGV